MAVLLALEFVDQTLHENHENWHPRKIKPSTVFLQNFSPANVTILNTQRKKMSEI